MDELEKLKSENEQLKGEIERFKAVKANQKQGMINEAAKGKLMARVPFVYRLESGKLMPAENFREIEEIFEEFLHENLSLNKLADKHKLSVNGLKKILKNFTYIGKIKFNNEVYNGEHTPLISTTLYHKGRIIAQPDVVIETECEVHIIEYKEMGNGELLERAHKQLEQAKWWYGRHRQDIYPENIHTHIISRDDERYRDLLRGK